MRAGTTMSETKSMAKDILLKAAEDVQSGMWCKDFYFATDTNACDLDVLTGTLALKEALASKRCAHGSLALATKLLGGSVDEYEYASGAVIDRLVEYDHLDGLVHFNDEVLPDDPFEAGQELAELFRKTAEGL